MLYAMIAICGVVSFLAVNSRYYPLKWVASFFWFGFLAYWMANSGTYLTKGEPTDTIVMLTLIMIAMLFLLWGFTSRRGQVNVEDEVSNTGSITRRIQKYTTVKKGEPKQASTLTESNLEYRDKVRKAARGGKTSKRK